MPSIKVSGGDTVKLDNPVALIDTGTSHIRVPFADFEKLRTLIEEYSETTC